MGVKQTGTISDRKDPWYCWWVEKTKDLEYDPVFHRIDALTPAGKLWREWYEGPANSLEILRRFAFSMGDRHFDEMRFDLLTEEEKADVIFAFAKASPIFALPEDSVEKVVFEPDDYITIERPPLHVHKEANDRLIREFCLAEVRKVVPKPKRQRRFSKTNDPSWLVPEIMNKKYVLRCELDNKEQDVLRLAEIKAKGLLLAWLSYFKKHYTEHFAEHFAKYYDH